MVALVALLFSSCSDEIGGDVAGTDAGHNKGEIVMFRAGTTDNGVMTRADGKTYYMPEGSRFICRLYYKSQEGTEEFDVSNPTDAWLKVNNTTGNSVYWNKDFASTSNLDSHGNDDDASIFYWMNRRPHAFLAWTDFNKMGNADFKYSNVVNSGMLKYTPYDDIVTTNDVSDVWIATGYQLYNASGEALSFTSWSDLKNYVEQHGEETAFKETQSSFVSNSESEDFTTSSFYYEYGWSCKYFIANNATESSTDATHKTSSWIKYLMYYDKFDYERVKDAEDNYTEIEVKENDIIQFLKDEYGHYLAVAEYDADDLTFENPHYYKTDINGNIRYNEEKPKYTFYMKRTSELQKNVTVQNSYRANVFDLKRGDRTAMTQQPDILQALTTQAPTSATLQANRIDLYFKHQFSQIQVNLKNSEDNSVKLEPGQIDKVELLGVTEKGYVFTDLQSNGTVRASSYKDVVATDYTDAQLAENPYGTSFNMFERELSTDEIQTTGAIKSYEAIAFGLLQAIRITWHETADEGGTIHESTYRVPETNEQNVPLRSLQSGVKYIWNIELRRGTLAVVRTEIIPWILNQESYPVDGTIVPNQ